MEVEEDTAGNLWATLRGARPEFVLVGSHIDSVPDGGWLDGALGVLAGVEMLRSRAEAGDEPPLSLRLVDFADEEGARFGSSLVGSRAVAGTLVPGPDEVDAARECGFDLEADLGSPLEGALAYVELHIEQGPVLERAGRSVCAVDGCAGVERHRVRLHGETAHAGAAPMDMRRDALVAAAEGIVRADGVRARTWRRHRDHRPGGGVPGSADDRGRGGRAPRGPAPPGRGRARPAARARARGVRRRLGADLGDRSRALRSRARTAGSGRRRRARDDRAAPSMTPQPSRRWSRR